MPSRSAQTALPLPIGWREITRAGVLHAISLAATAMTSAWSRASASRSSRQRALADADRLRAEIVLLKEELELKDARWTRLPARRRPYHGPVQRMRILKLRAARGWSVAQTAQRFLVTEDTIVSWMRRLDEEGEKALVQVGKPVNKYPEFVAYLVRQLKALHPALGKQRIAQMLARAGLHLGASTVGRMLKRKRSKDDVAAEVPVAAVGGVVTAKRPNHVWHVDLTTVPTSAGFWVPWLPFARVQRWPFCWWMAVALDHTSRLVVGFVLFKRRPTSAQVCAFLDRAIKKAGTKPKYIIANKGKEFFCATFKGWCRRRGIRPRFGAVGGAREHRDHRAVHPIDEVGVHATDHRAVPPRRDAAGAGPLRDLVQRAPASFDAGRANALGGVLRLGASERAAAVRAAIALASGESVCCSGRAGQGRARRTPRARTRPRRVPTASARRRTEAGGLIKPVRGPEFVFRITPLRRRTPPASTAGPTRSSGDPRRTPPGISTPSRQYIAIGETRPPICTASQRPEKWMIIVASREVRPKVRMSTW